MNLAIDVQESQNRFTLKITGEIDVYTAPELKDQLLPLTEVEGNAVEADLAGVSYMDSTGLGVFISAYKAAKEYDSYFELTHVQDRVSRLFKVTGLDEIMNVRFDESKEGQ